MRSSNLKKKFPSLRVGVLVIAAFALLGLMMFPSISEKMGLDENRSLAYGSGSGSEYDYCGSAYDDCLDDCAMDFSESLDALGSDDGSLEWECDAWEYEKDYRTCMDWCGVDYETCQGHMQKGG